MPLKVVIVSRVLDRFTDSPEGSPPVHGPTHILHLPGVDRDVSVRLLGQGKTPLTWVTKLFQKAPPHFVLRVVHSTGGEVEWVAITQATAEEVLSQLGVQRVKSVAEDFLSMAQERWERAIVDQDGVEWETEVSQQIRHVAEQQMETPIETAKRCAWLLSASGESFNLGDLSLWVGAQKFAEAHGLDFSRWIPNIPEMIKLSKMYEVGIDVVFGKVLIVKEFNETYYLKFKRSLSPRLFKESVKMLLYVHLHHEAWDKEFEANPEIGFKRVSSKLSGDLLPRSILYCKSLDGKPNRPLMLMNRHGTKCKGESHKDPLMATGTSARVKRAIDLGTKLYYAFVVQPECSASLNRYKVHHLFQGPGVAHVYGRVTWDGKDGVRKDGCIMPLYRGCLFNRLFRSKAPPIPKENRLSMALELVKAVARMHAQGYIHRDLKPENVLVHKDAKGQWHAYLIDFQYASHWTEHSNGGTPQYVSPEYIQARRESSDDSDSSPLLSRLERDAWALGLTLWALFFEIDQDRRFGERTFVEYIKTQYIKRVAILPGWLDNTGAAGAAAGESEADIVRSLLDPNPETRLTAAAAVERLERLIADAEKLCPSLKWGTSRVSTSVGSPSPAGDQKNGFATASLESDSRV